MELLSKMTPNKPIPSSYHDSWDSISPCGLSG